MRRALGFVATVVIALLATTGIARRGRQRRGQPRRGHRQAPGHPALDRRDARADQGGPGRRRPSSRPAVGLPRPLRAGRDPAARRRPDAHGQGRGPVRRDPRADPQRRLGRRDPRPRSSSCAASIDDAERRLTDVGIGAPGHRRRPVVPHHLPRGPRGRAAAVGAARLPRGGQGHPVPPADPRSAWRSPRRAHGRHRASPCRPCSPASAAGREVLEAVVVARRGGHAVLRLVLADLAARPQALDRVREGPGVERGLGRLDRVAGAHRVHRGLPRGLRDGALLPGAAVVRHRASAGYIALGFGLGVVALAVVSFFIFRLGRKLPDAHVPEHRRRAGDGHVGRLPRQRGPRAAGGRRHRLHRARRLAPRRRSSSPRPPATGRRCRRSSPRSSLLAVYVLGARLHVRDQAPPRAAAAPRPATPARRRRPPDPSSGAEPPSRPASTPASPPPDRPRPWACASASTSAARSPRPSPIDLDAPRDRRPGGPAHHPHRTPRASPPASSTRVAEVADGGRRRPRRPRRALDHPGGERAARGRRRPGRRDRPRPPARDRARSASAPRSTDVELSPGQAARHRAGASSTSPTGCRSTTIRRTLERWQAEGVERGLRGRGLRARRLDRRDRRRRAGRRARACRPARRPS